MRLIVAVLISTLLVAPIAAANAHGDPHSVTQHGHDMNTVTEAGAPDQETDHHPMSGGPRCCHIGGSGIACQVAGPLPWTALQTLGSPTGKFNLPRSCLPMTGLNWTPPNPPPIIAVA